ncbi:MAG: hypothetical protein P0Y66_08285 [Candidatus Kaistia colombiensis]|nr:MAG: hypothetical protein P0Y66_08285 [Kaistia sp.]
MHLVRTLNAEIGMRAGVARQPEPLAQGRRAAERPSQAKFFDQVSASSFNETSEVLAGRAQPQPPQRLESRRI